MLECVRLSTMTCRCVCLYLYVYLLVRLSICLSVPVCFFLSVNLVFFCFFSLPPSLTPLPLHVTLPHHVILRS